VRPASLEQRCKQPTRCKNFRLLIFFTDLFEPALHVSGDKLAHLQEHFLTVCTALVQCTHIAADRWQGWDGTWRRHYAQNSWFCDMDVRNHSQTLNKNLVPARALLIDSYKQRNCRVPLAFCGQFFWHTNILSCSVSSVVLFQQPPVPHPYGVPVSHFFAFNSGHHRDSEPVYSQTSNKPLQNNH